MSTVSEKNPLDEKPRTDEELEAMLDEVLEAFKDTRGNERSERSRLFAICITELQKVRAFFRSEVKGVESD